MAEPVGDLGREVSFESSRLRRVGRNLSGLAGSLRVMADWRSRWRLLRAKAAARSSSAELEPVALRIRGPAPLEVLVRPGSGDMGILYEHYARDSHLPPEGLEIRQACELGAGSALALADLARRHPRARLLGVEADPGNAAMARRNLEAFGARCTLVEAAVWDSDGRVVLGGEDTGLLAIREGGSEAGVEVEAITMDRLLAEHMPSGEIDFMHLDIAGAEPRVLTPDAEWLDRVVSITVQIYPDRGMSAARCAQILAPRGFEVTEEMHWWGGQVFGVRG